MRARAPFVLLLIAFAAPMQSGCMGCSPPGRASAQHGDAAVVVEESVVVVPVQEPAPESNAPLTCYQRAASVTGLLDTQRAVLCMGAWSPAPVACYLAARDRLGILDDQRILLCRCAQSTAPVACHEMLSRESALTDREIERFCAPTFTLGLLENCRPVGG